MEKWKGNLFIGGTSAEQNVLWILPLTCFLPFSPGKVRVKERGEKVVLRSELFIQIGFPAKNIRLFIFPRKKTMFPLGGSAKNEYRRRRQNMLLARKTGDDEKEDLQRFCTRRDKGDFDIFLVPGIRRK